MATGINTSSKVKNIAIGVAAVGTVYTACRVVEEFVVKPVFKALFIKQPKQEQVTQSQAAS